MNRWSFVLLDSEDRPIGDLDGVTGGNAEIVAQSSLGGSGRLLMDDRGQHIDWMSNRVQAWWHCSDGSWPVGTYLLSSPKEAHTETALTYDVGLLTKMNILAEDTVNDRYSAPAGTVIVAAVVSLIQSSGETRIAATPYDDELSAPLTWEAGTSKLTIINDLLQAAGFWSLWCDGSGQFRVEPYTNPADRAVAFEFVHGEQSIHFPEWDREQDNTNVPNRFLAIGQGSEDEEPLIGEATNTDPESPYSYVNRGRWITATEEGVEAETQAIIDAYAERKLREAMDPVARLAVTHAMIDLPPNALVGFTPEDGRRRQATVQKMSMNFTFDTDIRAEWREVL